MHGDGDRHEPGSDDADRPGGLERQRGRGRALHVVGQRHSASCDVGYTFGSINEETITASYGGDGSHAASSGSTLVKGGDPVAVILQCGSPDAVNEPDGCQAQLIDPTGNLATITGTVSFSSSGPASFSDAGLGNPCIPNGADGMAICVINYTPLASGTQTITATYSGDSEHAPNTGTYSVSVSAASTSTVVNCSPNPVDAYAITACTATVTDTSSYPSTPTGQVSWTSFGLFDGSCAIAGSSSSASCTVYFSFGSSGSPPIAAGYGGDSAHTTSSGSPSLSVVGDPTSTVVNCSPNPVDAGKQTTCTATVTDTSVSGSTPSGTVSFASSGSGSFSGGGSCSLEGGGSSASCAVGYTQSATGEPTVTASYGGDHANAASNGSTPVTVLPPAPAVKGAGPDVGPTTGNVTVTITGTNFVNVTKVKFGSKTAKDVTVVSSTELTATAPAHAAGSVAVRVTTPSGQSHTAVGDLFAYGAPTVSSFTPTSGITGSMVTITGKGFAPGVSVTFGALSSPKVTVESGTKLKARVPDGAMARAISVADAQGSGTSPGSFTPTLSITGFSPTHGPSGTVVVITGVGFNASSTVKFDGKAAGAPTLVSSTKLKVTVPTSAKSGPITVTNTTTPAGTVHSASSYSLT